MEPIAALSLTPNVGERKNIMGIMLYVTVTILRFILACLAPTLFLILSIKNLRKQGFRVPGTISGVCCVISAILIVPNVLSEHESTGMSLVLMNAISLLIGLPIIFIAWRIDRKKNPQPAV